MAMVWLGAQAFRILRECQVGVLPWEWLSTLASLPGLLMSVLMMWDGPLPLLAPGFLRSLEESPLLTPKRGSPDLPGSPVARQLMPMWACPSLALALAEPLMELTM